MESGLQLSPVEQSLRSQQMCACLSVCLLCTQVCNYVHMHVSACMCAPAWACLHVYAYVCLGAHVCLCMCPCMGMPVCGILCVHVWMYMCV